jgi:hypothetical protein
MDLGLPQMAPRVGSGHISEAIVGVAHGKLLAIEVHLWRVLTTDSLFNE